MMKCRPYACFVAGWLVVLVLSAGCNLRSSKFTERADPAATGDNLLSVQDMQSDLDTLWAAIKEVHPGYGIYASSDSLHTKYKEVRSSILEPLPENEFITHIYPFLCALGCGHTQLLHSANYERDKEQPIAQLPFQVLVREQKAWITNRKTGKLETGDEIISMNGVPVSTIIQKGYSLYCGDGYIRSFKDLFLSEYDGFSDACSKHYHWKPPYQMSVRSSNGSLRNITLNATDTGQYDVAVSPNKYANWTKFEGTGNLGMYFSTKGNTALLEVRQLVYSDTLIFENCFDQMALKGVKNLILDLRQNGGGDLRIAIRLLSHLMDSNFSIIKDLYARLPDPSVNTFSKYFDPALTDNFHGSCIPGGGKNGNFHMDIKPEFGKVYGPLPPARRNRFSGKLIVLIDGATFSSAALFVSALKAQRNNLLFVGRETAGTEEGCNGFAMQRLTLPATHVVVQFPWLRVVSMVRSQTGGRGLIPDFPVEYTPRDIVTQNDPDLLKALSLVQ